jgi:hypothetical protein
MENAGRFGWAAMLLALAGLRSGQEAQAAGGPEPAGAEAYHVLAPIESGNLLLFPVVRAGAPEKAPAETPFITLDEGLRSGEVEVTEAGNVQGLVRPRGPDGAPGPARYSSGGAQVNTLVLVNHAKKPLLLLAGEIVTGGKQDRVIAKDRIVPVNADPIDLSVFCIEPGRWTQNSTTIGAAGFGAAAPMPAQGFMAQPSVRRKAMVERDQQQVWDSVHGAMADMAQAAPPSVSPSVIVEAGPMPGPGAFGTTSYARAMQSDAVNAKVDEQAAPAMRDRAEVLEKLRAEHAVGVIAAVRGEIVWADVFANTDLLARYWTKLVRSYAAEGLAGGGMRAVPTAADAQRFLDAAPGGRETSEGDLGVYRYTELHGERAETFVLESLLPGTGYEVHVSRMKLRGGDERVRPEPVLR